jgi:phytoene dehydrogenase-like protein
MNIIIKNNKAVGVALENGDEYRSDIVISGLDPKQSFLNLINENELPSEFVQDIKNFRIRGSSGKVNLALDGLPDFSCLPGNGHHLRGAISISPSYDHLENAYDDAKYGNFSKKPFMDIILPSVLDPEMAPPGKHVMSCFVQYAPYNIQGGWNDEKREAFGDTVVDTLAHYAPNIKDIILHRQVLTPADLESTFGLTEGNIFHGELTIQQLFSLRPAVRWADYTTPIKNYYQCGSGTHPGGGITGSPGEMAAKKILGIL